MHKIGIVGLGFVGTAVETAFINMANVELHTHDKYKDTESLRQVVDNSDIIFLCLPTPMREDGYCDTSIIEQIANNIHTMTLPTCSYWFDPAKEKAVVIKSTVPPGTTEALAKKYPNHSFIFNPEFLTEKNFINDFLEQDRIFLGLTPNTKQKHVRIVEDLYLDFICSQENPGKLYKVDSRVAEMLKYTTNSFLATKVSFFNEIYDICAAADIDFNEVVRLIHLDKRIGPTHMNVPGHDGKRGWGGSCFPKDLNALIAFAQDGEHQVDTIVLDSAWAKNLMVREEYEWEKLAQVTGKYGKK